jgi:hypothetical protein
VQYLSAVDHYPSVGTRSAFDDAEVIHWEPYDGTFGLLDEAR